MNHFLALTILSFCIAAVFTFVNPDVKEAHFRYFLKLLGYMIVGSVAAAWLMYLLV